MNVSETSSESTTSVSPNKTRKYRIACVHSLTMNTIFVRMKTSQLLFCFGVLIFVIANSCSSYIDCDQEKIPDTPPLFPGCEDKTCSDENIILTLQGGIIYPEIDRINKIEGRVFVRLTVDIDGRASNFRIIRGISSSLDSVALIQARKLLYWQPAFDCNGDRFEVEYTLPVTFKLED